MQNHIGDVTLGLLIAAFFTIIWKRLDSTNGRIAESEVRLTVRTDRFENRMHAAFRKVTGHLMRIQGAMDSHDGRITSLEKKVR